MAEGQDEHGVAREHGRVVVPLLVDGGLAAPHVGTVHEVVVEEGVVVVSLDADGGGEGLFGVLVVEAAGEEEEGGAEALAAHGEDVFDGFVEALGTGGVGDAAECLLDGLQKHGRGFLL